MNAAGSFPCPDCGRVWSTLQRIRSHQHRAHERIPAPEHGTRYRLQQGCKCDECRRAERDYRRRLRGTGGQYAFHSPRPYAAESRAHLVDISCRCGARSLRVPLADVWDGRVPALDCACEHEAAA